MACGYLYLVSLYMLRKSIRGGDHYIYIILQHRSHWGKDGTVQKGSGKNICMKHIIHEKVFPRDRLIDNPKPSLL